MEKVRLIRGGDWPVEEMDGLWGKPFVLLSFCSFIAVSASSLRWRKDGSLRS
jgi:hypothetical protein